MPTSGFLVFYKGITSRLNECVKTVSSPTLEFLILLGGRHSSSNYRRR